MKDAVHGDLDRDHPKLDRPYPPSTPTRARSSRQPGLSASSPLPASYRPRRTRRGRPPSCSCRRSRPPPSAAAGRPRRAALRQRPPRFQLLPKQEPQSRWVSQVSWASPSTAPSRHRRRPATTRPSGDLPASLSAQYPCPSRPSIPLPQSPYPAPLSPCPLPLYAAAWPPLHGLSCAYHNSNTRHCSTKWREKAAASSAVARVPSFLSPSRARTRSRTRSRSRFSSATTRALLLLPLV